MCYFCNARKMMCFIIQWLPRVRVLMHDFLHYLITTACTQMGAQNRIDFLLFNGEGKAWDVAHSVWTKDKWFFFVNCNDEMFFLFFLFFIIEWPRGMRGRQKTASTYFFPRPSSWFNDPRTCTAARARTCAKPHRLSSHALYFQWHSHVRACARKIASA